MITPPQSMASPKRAAGLPLISTLLMAVIIGVGAKQAWAEPISPNLAAPD